jgi:hypothetical protein
MHARPHAADSCDLLLVNAQRCGLPPGGRIPGADWTCAIPREELAAKFDYEEGWAHRMCVQEELGALRGCKRTMHDY